MRKSGRLVLLWIVASVFTAPAFGEERADYYPIESGGGARVYCFSDRGLQLSPGGKVTACIHARNAPAGSFQMEGGSIGSAYCQDGQGIAFSPVDGKLKSCTISYAIKGLSVSGASIQCAAESVARFREDGHIVSCEKAAPPQPVASASRPAPAATMKNSEAAVCASLMTALDAHAKKYASPGCIVRLEFMPPYNYQNGECVGAHKVLSRCPQQDNIEREIFVNGSKDNPARVSVGAIRQQYEKEYPRLSWGREATPAAAQPVPGTGQAGQAQTAQPAKSAQPAQAQQAAPATSGSITGTSIAGWSSELDDKQWSVRNLLDGRIGEGAGWTSKNNPTYPQTITIRLPEDADRKILRVEINPFITMGKENWAKDISIYVAPSNVDWGLPVGRITLAQKNEFQSLEFEPRYGRVVIVNIESNWGGSNVGMGEIRIFDNASASNSPPASSATQNSGAPEGVAVKSKIVKDDMEQLEAGIFFQAALVNMVSKFVDARLDTDALLKTDFRKTTVPQWNAEHDKTTDKWKTAEKAIKHYQQIIAKLPETRLARLQDQEWRIVKVAHALTRGELLAVYDAAPPGMKLATVAAILNVDKDTANKILQDVREGVNKHLGNVADANQRAANALSAISTGSKVLITVGSIAATGGGSLALSGSLATKAVAAGEIGAVAVNGADLVFEVSELAVNIGIKDPARQYALVTAIKNAREWKPLTGATYVLTVMDLSKMFKGLNHVLDRREAWLNTAGKNIDAKKLEYEKALKEFKSGLSGNLLSITDFIQTQDPTARFVVVPDPDGKSVKVLPMSGLLKLESYIKDSKEAIKKLNLSLEQTRIMEDALSRYAAAEMKALSMPPAPEPASCSGLGYKDCRETPGCNATFSTSWYVCCRESEAVDGFCPKPK